MKRKKLIIAAVVMLLVFLVGGAIAFFTDTEEVKNTFTIGKVDITLTEPNWNENNAKDLLPGATVPKDPTVTVAADSADAYVFVKVEVPCVGTGTTRREVFSYTLESGWTELAEAEKTCAANAVATHVYAHTASMSANDTAKLFSNVVLDGDLTQEEAEGLVAEIPVNAYAIQKDNVAGATYTVWNTNFNS
jgi:predicted ribosomally synthesized peptide with SipW-like signal peptide